MKRVALLTPTYGRDLELCTLLCESVDHHVTSFAHHYLLVPDSDLQMFAHLESEHRSVLPASRFLPRWLRPLPRMVQRKRRQFWWSLRAKPVSGWHVQQFLKIAAAIELPHDRYCILDSDVAFFRNFDVSKFEYPDSIPLLKMPDEIKSGQGNHARWVETSHELLGLPAPSFPAPDFIGHIIFWDQQTTRAMTERIEAVTKRSWIEALCRTREFSEYMLYGYFVQNDVRFSAQHIGTTRTQCVSYWDKPKLDRKELTELLRGACGNDVAFSVASFSGTSVETIRSVIEETGTPLASLAPKLVNDGEEPTNIWSEARARINNRLANHLNVSRVQLRNRTPMVSFTFDDMAKSAATNGAKTLERHGAHGTFYVSGGLVGGKSQLWAAGEAGDIASLLHRGHEIGCHTFSHRRTSDLDAPGLENEIQRNRQYLQSVESSIKVTNFAYPFGQGSFKRKEQLRTEFQSCRGIMPGINSGATDLQFLRAMPLIEAHIDRSGIEEAFDRAETTNGWLIFYTHDVSGKPSIYGCSPELIEFALEEAERRNIPVLNMAEALRYAGF